MRSSIEARVWPEEFDRPADGRTAAAWRTLTLGPPRLGKDPLPVNVLLVDAMEQRVLLQGRSARRRLPAGHLGQLVRRVDSRIALLEQLPTEATHLAENAPTDRAAGIWTVWTVHAWLYDPLIPKLAATGTVHVIVDSRGGEVSAVEACLVEETAVVDAAAKLCRIPFQTTTDDSDIGASLRVVDPATGYARRFLLPDLAHHPGVESRRSGGESQSTPASAGSVSTEQPRSRRPSRHSRAARVIRWPTGPS